MPCKEGLRKVNQIRNNPVIRIRPKTGKLKTVAGLVLTFRLFFLLLFCNVRNTGGIAVVLGLRAVADDKYLHVFKQPASGPETFPVVAPYLIKGSFMSTPLRFSSTCTSGSPFTKIVTS